ncbi:hypothetical protein [Rhodococcus sp. X156]|nr:hypothetical protein [Rhodococcus sp. X156]
MSSHPDRDPDPRSDDSPELTPGPEDKGGHGGMATREVEAETPGAPHRD